MWTRNDASYALDVHRHDQSSDDKTSRSKKKDKKPVFRGTKKKRILGAWVGEGERESMRDRRGERIVTTIRSSAATVRFLSVGRQMARRPHRPAVGRFFRFLFPVVRTAPTTSTTTTTTTPPPRPLPPPWLIIGSHVDCACPRPWLLSHHLLRHHRRLVCCCCRYRRRTCSYVVRDYFVPIFSLFIFFSTRLSPSVDRYPPRVYDSYLSSMLGRHCLLFVRERRTRFLPPFLAQRTHR